MSATTITEEKVIICAAKYPTADAAEAVFIACNAATEYRDIRGTSIYRVGLPGDRDNFNILVGIFTPESQEAAAALPWGDNYVDITLPDTVVQKLMARRLEVSRAGSSLRGRRDAVTGEMVREERDTPWVSHGGVGRNDPCPCGSLLKFKKCCG